MKFRTLLLGTAAALAVSGAAQAADLAIAVEPIDYVKICDAFGVGYWYIPGTDTCLKIGGYVQLDVWFYDNSSKASQPLYGVGIPSAETPDPFGNFRVPVPYAQDNYSRRGR